MNIIKKRILELDILRGIAFIFVVIQHTIGGFSNAKEATFIEMLILKFIYTIGKIAVPIFLTLTGMVLFYRYKNNISIKDFYEKRIKYIFIPYMLWSAIYLIINKQPDRLTNLLMEVLCGNCRYHLWYMGMILRIYLFFPLILIFLRYISKQTKYIKASFFVLYFIFYWWALKHNNTLTNNIGIWIFKNPTKLQQRFINITPILWSVYFLLGNYIMFNYDKFKKILLKYKAIIISMYFIFLGYSYYNEIKSKIGNPLTFIKFDHAVYIISCCISILFFYIIASLICNSKNIVFKYLSFIGKYSFAAYIIHIRVLQVIAAKETLFINRSNTLVYSVVLCILTVIITPCICYALNFVPFSSYIIGIKSKPKILKHIKNNFNKKLSA